MTSPVLSRSAETPWGSTASTIAPERLSAAVVVVPDGAAGTTVAGGDLEPAVGDLPGVDASSPATPSTSSAGKKVVEWSGPAVPLASRMPKTLPWGSSSRAPAIVGRPGVVASTAAMPEAAPA